ncbi:50S ribosomal protein L11 methyltransferase [Marinilongibacter aquaticus]|uniref:50S ribosomal protein L11 methyltransferase n=1 Tax=Marinilongibacter aquaticus TaxID=2975157 RepID=UPI0021BD8571|nr:50S ribosomal protein L11 methyltransferase [Marinilongibacter aquaticus]UBM58116.1 50S ribosomal protein L11 methyltransferase [Marinilongibacter aquaticus]
MDFIEANIEVNAEFAEILVAELAEIGFDTFLDTDDGLLAYATEDLFDAQAFKQVMEDYAAKTTLFYAIKGVKKENWNAEWENSFQPIAVGSDIWVRATFHEANPDFPHEIVITPKMSFGTGHHETTSQMLALQLGIEHTNKKVLDVGTGTGILAIMAEKLGADSIRAFDIDEWSVENTLENIALNHCEHIGVGQGTIQDEEKDLYDIVLANINRNILLDEIPTYNTFLKPEGFLLMSGFYESDKAEIDEKCSSEGLKKVNELSKNNWVAVVYRKQ